MAIKTTFVVQTFRMQALGLTRGEQLSAEDDEDAIDQAKAAANAVGGAAVLRLVTDHDDRTSSAEVIAQFGYVPDGFAESLRFGR